MPDLMGWMTVKNRHTENINIHVYVYMKIQEIHDTYINFVFSLVFIIF